MSYYYPGGRAPGGRPSGQRPVRRSGYEAQNETNGVPTLDDYNRLVGAYNELLQAHNEMKAGAEKQTRLLSEANEALKIRDEALRNQGEDLKQALAEVAFLKAVANQQQKENEKRKDLSYEELQERYMRLQAEMENLRRRWEQRAASDTAEARRTILRDMLPLADHLEMALQHGGELDGKKAKNFVGNIEATQRAFQDALRRYGVEPIVAEGAPFDPNIHEAVGQIPLANAPSGTETGQVAHVVQRGYMDGNSLLRPARVLVAGE